MFTLGRKIDIKYPTNRLILIIVVLTTGGSYFLTGEASSAWRAGAMIFLTWALTRELDPKREYAAFAAVFFAFPSLFTVHETDFMTIFFLLLMLRFISKITGDKNTVLDMTVLFGLASILGYIRGTSVYPLLLLGGTILNVRNTRDNEKNRIFMLLAAAMLAGSLYFIGGFDFLQPQLEAGWTFHLYLVTTASYLGFVIIDRDKSTFDDQGELVEASKVLDAQISFAVGISLLLFLAKVPIGNMTVYIASMLGYLIYGIMVSFKNPMLPVK